MRAEREKITKPVVRKFAREYDSLRLRKSEIETQIKNLQKGKDTNPNYEKELFMLTEELLAAKISYNLFVWRIGFSVEKFKWAS